MQALFKVKTTTHFCVNLEIVSMDTFIQLNPISGDKLRPEPSAVPKHTIHETYKTQIPRTDGE